MKKNICLAVFAALLMPTLVRAQSVFDGTWKVDLKTAQFPQKPDVYVLQNGMYECKTCVPAIRVKADGTDQKVGGYPYFDTMNMKVVDGRTLEETDKKNGKIVTTSKEWVSPDGNTLMWEFSDSSNSNGTPVTGKGRATRVAKGPEGSHAISGSWKMQKVDQISENATSVTFQMSGDEFTMTSPTGQSYSAKTDGTEAPYKGDPGITSVSVKKISSRSVEETDKREGKVMSVTRMTVAADGKTMKIASDDKLHGTHSEVMAMKQ